MWQALVNGEYMNHFDTKFKKILELFLQNDSFLTLVYLSQHVGISKRSIQNYLHRIESWLVDAGLSDIKLLKKQGYGIKLLINDIDRKKLDDLLILRNSDFVTKEYQEDWKC